ncbi:uncharacterized protein LOC120670668 [Panicum virgatum]|uniref:Uncharacterized protein n=1 Tax=Panicum virgatum TaxID=38727 RepID=A0A8T0TCY6_PANVG|nr:uncharacterized protein LOC120670668 [Panicum virgatum]KAG2605929.1 hypothetical protein PVAP13_4NG150100 [Panicum virgatum]
METASGATLGRTTGRRRASCPHPSSGPPRGCRLLLSTASQRAERGTDGGGAAARARRQGMAEGRRQPHPGEEAGRARGMAAAEVRKERGEGERGGGARATRRGTAEVCEDRTGTWPLRVHGTSPPRCADSGPSLGQRHAAHPPSAPQIHRRFSQIRRSLPFPEPAGSHGTQCVRGAARGRDRARRRHARAAASRMRGARLAHRQRPGSFLLISTSTYLRGSSHITAAVELLRPLPGGPPSLSGHLPQVPSIAGSADGSGQPLLTAYGCKVN